MAYTAIITKNNVRKMDADDYMLSVNVVIEDDSVEVINKNYNVRYNDSWSINDVRTKLQNKIKVDWDKYLAEQAIYNNATFDTMLSNIDVALETYMNT